MTTYKVTGPGWRDHKHGDVFDADLDPDVERRARERGAIKVIKRAKSPKPESEEEADDA